MDRRKFLTGTAAVAGAAATNPSGIADVIGSAAAQAPAAEAKVDPKLDPRLDPNLHRFGVNYTPSHNWWFCWNDWDADPIKKDLDAIMGLGADHVRVLLIWPYFQPNPTWVSTRHLARLGELLSLMGERNLYALVTVFTGQLSAWYFLPPFYRAAEGFYTNQELWTAQELFVRELARVMKLHANVIGFDIGNEVNTCWSAPTQEGDAWMTKMLALMASALPDHLHVNGVDHMPWFANATFSQRALASQRLPVMHCYPYWTGAVKYGGAMDPPSVKLLAGMAALIRAYAGTQQKPVWAGEFNTCIEQLTEKQQAQWLEKSVLAGIDEGVSWFTYWDSHDVDRRFGFNPLEYSLGLLTNDGQIKEQGRVFHDLAVAHRGKAVTFPKQALPAPPQEASVDATWRWLLNWMGWTAKNS